MDDETKTLPAMHSGLAPDSIVRQELSDWRVLLGGGRALLLQLAHPAVAAGVAQHSTFTFDPWKRLSRTLDLYIGGIIFGSTDEAVTAGMRLRAMHARIKGIDSAGRCYHALDPSAFHWVHATLIDGLVTLAERFGNPLKKEALARAYGEMREVGRLCGLREQDMPPDWPSFRNYFDETCDLLEDNPVVHQLMATIACAPRPPGVPLPDHLWRTVVWPPLGHLVTLCAVGLLPASVRQRLRLPWNCARELELNAYAALIRRVFPFIPARIRMHSWAYTAYGRAPA
jgi:uncharacterized protein (DUF2236 family)